MLNFISVNWPSITIIGLAVVYVIYLSVTREWENLRKLAYKSMLVAEMAITGTKKGQKRFEYVFQKFYSLLPYWIRLFYTQEDIRKMLQEWFNLAKDGLDDGEFNNSISKDTNE